MTRLARPSAERLATPILAGTVLLAAAWPADPPAALRCAGLAALLVALAVLGHRLAARWLPLGAGAASRACAAGVFATATAVVVATALGIAGRLAPRPFLYVVAGLAVAAALLPPVRRRPIRSTQPCRPRRPPPRFHALRLVERTLLVAGLAALVLATCTILWRERWTPPRKLDDASYHLATVGLWTHTHDLRTIKFDRGDPSTPFYPLAGELIDWALIAPLRDSDLAARWSQLLFGLLSLPAVAAVARRLGTSRRGAGLAVVLWLSVPRAFPLLLPSAGNDHATGLFALALVDAVLLFARRPGRGAALYAGCALGLLLGTKYLGVLFAVPILIVGAAATLLRARRRPARPRHVLAAASIGGAAAVGVGGYTYLRNAVALGNPLFPAPISLFGRPLLPGWKEATLAVRRLRPEFAIDLPGFLLDGRLFGEIFPFVVLPLALAAPLLALLPPGRLGRRVERAAVLALPVGLFLVFLRLVHDHRDSRYLFAALALAAVAATWSLDRASRRGRAGAVVRGLAGGAAGAALLDQSLRLLGLSDRRTAALALALLGVSAVLVAVAARRREHSRDLTLRPASAPLPRGLPGALGTVLLLALFAAAGPAVLRGYRSHMFDAEPLARFLDLQTPRGAVIAYVGHNQPYVFAGSRLQNRVEIVPTRRDLAGRHFTWGGDGRFPFARGRYPIWLRNLERLDARWIVVVRSGFEEPEHDWMRYHQGRFQRVAASGDTELWSRRR